jgi:formylglycine-generating enzyme required for sulfatase activity
MLLVAASADAEVKCGADAVVAGTICLDRYEASVWRVRDPSTINAALVGKIRSGSVTRGDLTAAGSTQLGSAGDDYAPCVDDGRNCASDIYAVSIQSVVPARFVTWFQAQQACGNSGKRLPTSAEWQIGANGTPDPEPGDPIADCNNGRGAASLTGERSHCVSARGAFDMVGNATEWVTDWVPLSTKCPGWAGFSDDHMCLAGADETRTAPGALVRGGSFSDGAGAGPLSVAGDLDPGRAEDSVGFRCVRALPEPGGVALLGVGMALLALLARRPGSGIAAALVLAAHPAAADPTCPADSVPSGTVCMDAFETSVWRVPAPTTINAGLVAKIQQGRAAAADLEAGGATQLGTFGDDYAPCLDTGQSCANDIYAVSLLSRIPSSRLTWFQAQEACANSGKRLPTSAEWQMAASGTPDPGPDDGATDCNSGSTGTVNDTGARSACVSARGAFDMVGNVEEWVADWVPLSTVCLGWGAFSDDEMCLAGASTTELGPGALVRGGSFVESGGGGPLRVFDVRPSFSSRFIGFRCAR